MNRWREQSRVDMTRKRPLARHNGLVRPGFSLGSGRTSVSLDPVMWEAFCEIAEYQDKTPTQLINEIDRDLSRDVGLSAAIRVYVVEFYRARVNLRQQ
jgi:predicted DNA-binding ribbon-helix-helix protein